MFHLTALRPEAPALPITPAAAKAARVKSLPPQVIAVVNDLIVSNLKQRSDKLVEAKIPQSVIVKYILLDETLRSVLLLHLQQNETPNEHALATAVTDLGWLDFEDVFELSGWSVKYDKPGFNESCGAFFKFTSKE